MVWVKRLGILVAAVFALLVAAIIYVVVFVDPNQFKGELQQVAKDKANVNLRLDGDISWSFFPRIGLSLEDIGVALADDPEILSFSKAEFGVALMPLFERRIEVTTVRLEDLVADLKVDENGQPNWQLQTASTSENENTPEPTDDNSSSDTADAPFTMPDIALDELAIVNAQINYEDATADMRASVNSDITFTDVRLDQAWPMQMDATIVQSNMQGENPLTAEIDFDANFTLFAERQSFSLEDVALNTSLTGNALPTSPLDANVSIAQLDFDMPQENATLEGLVIETLGMNISGQLQAYQVMSSPEFTTVMDIAEFSPKEVLNQLNIELPEMADDSVLESATLSLAAEGSAETIKAQPISMTLDDTTLEANALVHLSPLNWDISIAGANLDLDRYLPPESDAEPAASENASNTGVASDSASAASEELFPVELIRTLNGHVGIVFENVKVKNLQLDKLELDSTQTNGKVMIAPAQVVLYDGTAEVQAQLDVTGNTPELNVMPSIDSVQILPFLKDFMDLEKVQGATNLTGEITTRGNQVDALMRNLNGDLLVNINDGALIGTNYTKMVCKGIAFVRSEDLNESAFEPNTPFEIMRIPAKIVNGEISTPGLTLTSLTLGVTGDGKISLPNNHLDYETRVSLVGSGLDQSCIVDEDVANIEFPIMCEGNFTDDAASLCRPDFKGFVSAFADQKLSKAKAAAQAKLDAEKARAKEKLDAEKARAQEKLAEEKARLDEKKEEAKQELEDKLKSKLNGLF
ncbi:AsmA family protein [Marinomonas ostreistagni]|uniref:AsmA family protein n=1 Tax=Marinomonas ostreistagni TaxID=359209 RepID=UPI00194FFA05|nr:AsmA family protein [Marinomonas ostreistagni]MBM6552235.1 AsmA family protein [Marinomonas ostreistagni]